MTGLCFLAWIFTACGKHIGWFAWFVRSTLVWSIAAVVWIGVENAVRKLEKEVELIAQKGSEVSLGTWAMAGLHRWADVSARVMSTTLEPL